MSKLRMTLNGRPVEVDVRESRYLSEVLRCELGLKGTKIGEAAISEKHANFILAGPGASSEDVLRLIDLVKTNVRERLGVELETEMEIW